MSEADASSWDRRKIRRATLAAVAGVVLFIVLAAVYLPGLAGMLAASFLIAYLLDPLIDRFEARGINRTFAVVVFVIAVFLALALAAGLMIPVVARQAARLIAGLPAALDWAGTRVLPWLEGALGVALPRTVGDLSATLEGYASSIDIDVVGRAAKTLLGAFSGTVQALVAALNFLLVPVFSVYFLRSFDDMSAALYRLIPDAYRERVGARIKEVDEVLGAFVRGQVTVCAAMAVLYSLGLWLVGVGPWLLIGLLSGFGNLVPYLGTALGIGAAALAVLVQFGDWQHLLGALAVFAVVQTVEGFVLTPRIVGEKVGLHPVVVMVAILAGGEVFGFTGILLAVPVTAALGVVFRQLLQDYRASALFAESRAASGAAEAAREPEEPPAAPTA